MCRCGLRYKTVYDRKINECRMAICEKNNTLCIFLILIVITVMPSRLYPQGFRDCRSARPVCTTVIESGFQEAGSGLINESGISDCLQSEKNSYWLILHTGSDGDLGFLLTPNNPPDTIYDYDWAVYNITGYDCSDLKDKWHQLEVSCNFSDGANDPVNNGKTGPTGQTNQVMGGKDDSPFNAKIKVLKDETYMIFINTWLSNPTAGFTVDFSYSSPGVIQDNTPPVMKEVNAGCGSNEIKVSFSEYLNCSTVRPEDFEITGGMKQYNITAVESNFCGSIRDYDREFTLKTDEIIDPGNYQLVLKSPVEDYCGNAAVVPQQLGFSIEPLDVTLEADNTTVCSGSPVNLNVVSTGSPPFKYEWNPDTSLSCSNCPNPSAIVSERTTFHVTVTDDNNCTGEAEINIDTRPSPKIVVIKGDTSICGNNGGTAHIEIERPVGYQYTFTWDPATGLSNPNVLNPDCSPVQSTSYTFTLTNKDNGCSSSKVINIRLGKNIYPEITENGSSGNVELCTGETKTLDAGDSFNGEVYRHYQWFKDDNLLEGDTSRYLEVSSEGLYDVFVTSEAGCTGEDRITVSEIPGPDFSLEYKNGVCVGEVATLRVTASAGADLSYLWQNTEGFLDPADVSNPRVKFDSEGTKEYPVAVTDNESGCTSYDTARINVTRGLGVSLGDDQKTCPGKPVSISVSVIGGTPEYNYTWEPNTNVIFPDLNDKSKVVLEPEETTDYKVTVSDANGCSGEDEVHIEVLKPQCELSVTNLTEDPRSRGKSLFVKFVSEKDLLDCDPDFVGLILEWDISIFNPMIFRAKGEVLTETLRNRIATTRKWSVSAKIPKELISKPGENLLEIRGDMMLGAVDSADVKIVKADWGGIKTENTFHKGYIKLTNLCYENGVRLLDYPNIFEVERIKPNPAVEMLEIKMKKTAGSALPEIKIYDMMGKSLNDSGYRILQQSVINSNDLYDDVSVKLDIAGLRNGLYRLVVNSGQQTGSALFVVAR